MQFRKIWFLVMLLHLMGTVAATAQDTLLWPRTNLLLPLLNVGAELPLNNRWSVAADVYYPWIPRAASHKNCFQAFGVGIEGRYWLGKSHGPGIDNRAQRLLGHSVGAFVMSGYYDWERNYSGYQGDFVMGGVDYLYAMPVFRGKMHLELSLGVGYFYSKATHYDVFESGGKGYREKDYRRIFEYFGPLKAGVALVVPLVVGRGKNKKQP